MLAERIVLPMSLEGVIKHWLCMSKKVEIEWVPPYVLKHQTLQSSDFEHIGLFAKRRISRLFSLDGAPTGPWMARAIGACSRMGRISLAIELIECWVEALEPDAWTAARGRRLLEVEVKRCRNVIQWQREWPRGVLHLEDQPSWMVIPMVRFFRIMKIRDELVVLSGGHRLLPEQMKWIFKTPSFIPHKVSQIAEFSPIEDDEIPLHYTS